MAASFDPFNNQGATSVATFLDTSTNITYKFPFNINSLNWNYNLNTQNYSTLGGRVTQILSVAITTLQIQGEAGSRKALIKMFEDFKTMQDNQNQNKKNIIFSVPSRNLQFRVWLSSFQIGWDYTTITYPYSITAEVDEVISENALDASRAAALQHVVNNKEGNIGFSGIYTGLSTSNLTFRFQDITTAMADQIVRKNTPKG
jgi:hypothetical protein